MQQSSRSDKTRRIRAHLEREVHSLKFKTTRRHIAKAMNFQIIPPELVEEYRYISDAILPVMMRKWELDDEEYFRFQGVMSEIERIIYGPCGLTRDELEDDSGALSYSQGSQSGRFTQTSSTSSSAYRAVPSLSSWSNDTSTTAYKCDVPNGSVPSRQVLKLGEGRNIPAMSTRVPENQEMCKPPNGLASESTSQYHRSYLGSADQSYPVNVYSYSHREGRAYRNPTSYGIAGPTSQNNEYDRPPSYTNDINRIQETVQTLHINEKSVIRKESHKTKKKMYVKDESRNIRLTKTFRDGSKEVQIREPRNRASKFLTNFV